MRTVLKQFKVYAPPATKAEHTLNKDGTLTITGVASTTNQDLDGEIVSEKALVSLKDQAVGLNLHLDHNHDYDGGIGAITEAHVENNQLYITATILAEHAKGVRDRLALGMNMGFSIGGIPIIKNSRSNVIDDFILLEISLTLLPANWDTFGTVESKGLVESTCLTGACYHILKEKKLKDKTSEDEDVEIEEDEDDDVDVDAKSKKSEESEIDDENEDDDAETVEKSKKKTNKKENDDIEDEDVDDEDETIEEEEIEESNKNMSKEKTQQLKAIDDATKQELVNIVNEAIINLKPLILDELKEDMTKLVQDVVATSLGEVVPKALDGIKEEVKAEIPVQAPAEETQEEEETVPVAEKEGEVPQDETPAEETPVGEVVEEEKEVPEKVPLSGIPARKDDVGYANVANPNPVQAPSYTIDSKAVADAVVDEIWSKLNFKRTETVQDTKLNEFKKTHNVTTKSKFLDNETRDKFGRNKKYL